ncbi:MAG: membrane protein insertase YidC, partial [Acidobacteriota bacterium]|nr:membrane protein insertase YidC [Acidobacteriota bacterium]
MNEMSEQSRIVVFLLLAAVVFLIWSKYFAPQPPPNKPQHPQATQSAPGPSNGQMKAPPSNPVAIPAVQASAEKTIVVENDEYRVELSNRGAVAKSWRLKKYLNLDKPPQALDLVHSDSAAQLGWPLSLVLQSSQDEQKANTALYEVEPATDELKAPARVTFRWSDGHLAVTKTLNFSRDYQVSMDVSVTDDGRPVQAAVAWRGGFGDASVSGWAERADVFYNQSDSIERQVYKKLGVSGSQSQPQQIGGPMQYLGLEDQFFAAAFLPENQNLSLWDWTQYQTVTTGSKPVSTPIASMAAGSSAAEALHMRLFVGPKDIGVLRSVHPSLSGLINFGWTSIIAKPLLYLLQWMHKYISNYGWAIVVMTLALNLPLFPLRLMSQKSMRKMQKLAPEMRAIQDRYKKYSMRDPRRRKMQEEIMELYQQHGVNPIPIGACLPMLIQLPIWWALDRVLEMSIELRHAPWTLWIHDLSVKDPYYILPIAMGFAMYLSTAMTPQAAGVDPAQQKMMKWMPIFMAAFFINLSSGLNLYILTSSLVGAGQQVYLNRTQPM